MADVEIEIHERVARITLNRPHRKNAFTLEMIDAISAFVENPGRPEECRVIVIGGAGGAFCSGVDLDVARAVGAGEEAGRGFEWKSLLFERIHRLALALERCDLPVIAAVDGPAIGAGMDISLMCDMRFAAPGAYFCSAYINLGVVPGDGGCYFLPRIVGLPKALELLLGGERIAAEEAHRIGLVNRIYPSDTLQAATMEFASLLAGKSPVALRMTKRTAIQSLGLDLRTSLDLISSHMGIVQTLSPRQRGESEQQTGAGVSSRGDA